MYDSPHRHSPKSGLRKPVYMKYMKDQVNLARWSSFQPSGLLLKNCCLQIL